MKKIIHVSVREMVEFVLRCGDIDSRYSGEARALLGVKIHKQVQKKHEKKAKFDKCVYESEVGLKTEIEYKDFVFEIEGRADGIVERKNEVIIEEIKSTTRDTDKIEIDNRHWHFAQAKCYGFLFGLLHDKSEFRIFLTYCNTESMEEISFEEKYQFNELKQFFYDILEKYYDFEKLCYDMHTERNKTAEDFNFPFGSYRKGQREFSAAVYKTIADGKKLFAQAPTGTGKTISTVFPTIKYFNRSEEINTKVFYLTAKNITRQAAEKCIGTMIEKGLKIKAVVLTAKEKICANGEIACYPQKCRFAKGHYDRVNNAVRDILENEYLINKDLILEYAEKHNVCPFEFSLDITSAADFVICDYNYAYNPKVRLKRFFAQDAKKGTYIGLIDEAHNLVDRAREMFSAELSKADLMAARRGIKDKSSQIYKIMSKINDFFLAKMKMMPEEEAVIMEKHYPEEFLFMLEDFSRSTSLWLEKNEGSENYDKILEYFFLVKDFLRIGDLYSEDYAVLYQKKGKELKIKLLNLDSSRLLKSMSENMASQVFFSATLTPMEYFADIFGGDIKKDNCIKLCSPFKSENLCVMTDTGISTKYKDRENSYEPIADRIAGVAAGMRGNYLVFFSSYEYLRKVTMIFKAKYPNFETIIQEKNMNERRKEDFLREFKEDSNETLIGFAVLGGVFSEGIDLVGKRLIGSVIVGVGMPLISIERNIIMEYYDSKFGKGFEYAYIYPGMNKVLQAVGRVIRTEEDRGSVLLIDRRFSEEVYREMFPAEWKVCHRIFNNDDVKRIICDFFKTNNN